MADPAGTPVLVVMHGIGGRQDLPLPFELVVAGAAAAVILSFVVLGLAWRTVRYETAQVLPLPRVVTMVVDASWFRWLVRGAGLALGLYMAMALVFGKDSLVNPIFGFIYVWVWVGLVPVSLLLGPVWATLNPLRTLHLLACAVLRTDPNEGLYRLPARVGMWPAAVGLFAFVWLELVAPDRVTIPVLMAWLALYVVTTLFGAVLFGRAWIRAADPFENYAHLMAKLSVWTRDSHGQVALTNPLRNLTTLTPRPGLVTFIAVLLGSTAYDGFSNSSRWVGWVQNSPVPPVLLATAMLTGFIAIVASTYSAATALSGNLTHTSRRALPGLFAHTLVPIALGYVIAHYLTLLILEGQRTAIQLNDPLSRGWNVFGTAEYGVNIAIVNYPGLIGLTQAGAVVAGHIAGVLTAHDRSLALFPRHTALTGQVPLLAVMIGYTITGLLLLFSI